VILQTILDCSPPNEAFYVKCGYEKAGSEMHHYYDEEAVKHGV
jgi:glucosamine-phosphate N-acetyltransferase